MTTEQDIKVIEKVFEHHNLGSFKVRKNEEESNEEQTYWDVGPLDKDGTLMTVFFIVHYGSEFGVFVWIHYPGSYDEPPSCDEKEVGTFSTFHDALKATVLWMLQESISGIAEEIYMAEMKEEE